MNISIIVFSVTNHTYEMGCEIKKGAEEAGAEARVFNIRAGIDMDFVSSSDAVIFGTPTYLASSVWQIKKFLEEDAKNINLSGKLGGAFATAHYAQGGADTAIMDILGQLLVKGMLVYSGGSSQGLPFIHHGPVALDKIPEQYEDSRDVFRIYGRRMAEKAKELFSK